MFASLATILVVLSLSSPIMITALAEEPPNPTADQKAEPSEKCAEHGVKKSICTRCNPKLEALFKAKGDWCEEHKRPETQCVLCHPELAKKGVK